MMLENLAHAVLGRSYAWVLAIPCLLFLYLCLVDAIAALRLKRHPGVRAHVLARTPIGALQHVWTYVSMQLKNKTPEFYSSLFEKIGPSGLHCVELTILGQRRIFTEEPSHIKAILAGDFANFGKGQRFHDMLSPFLGDGIFTTNGQMWHQSRSLIRPMFATEKIRDLDIFERWSNALIAKISTSGETVDISGLFYRMTLDVTTDYLLGQSVDSLEDAQGGFAKAFESVQSIQMIITILGPLGWLWPRGTYNRGIRELESFIQPFIETALAMTPGQLEQLSKSDKEYTFLHHLALFTRDPKVIRDQIMAVLLAGRDTTAATLSWCLYEMSQYPKVWKKLREQVLERVGPTERPTYKDIKDLTYLTYTLNETLRRYPVLPFNVRTCLANTILPGKLGEPDITVLEGDSVVYSTLTMQRRKDLYPPVSDKFPDPAIWSPERWDHWSPTPWHHVPFNGGPRVCIGQNFAMVEMAFVLIRMLQKYERIEYRGDPAAQFLKSEIVGRPGQGVPMAFF